MSADHVRDRPARRDKQLKGFVKRNGRASESAVFENISDTGCCLRGEYEIGEWLVVMLPTLGTVEAQVRWSIGGRAGLRLERTTKA